VENLSCLKEVLQEFCDKPGGIRIANNESIPLEKAKGRPPRLLALLNIDGPPPTEPPGRTAYLYVLFYDSKRLGLAGTQSAYVDPYYPCAIYFDVAYWPHVTRHIHRQILTHELGHVLGLSKNSAHGDGLHCRNNHCVMAGAFQTPLLTWLLSIPPPKHLQATFCHQCRQDLRPIAVRPDPQLRFCGPVLVRQQQDYSVGFLPGCTRLWFDTDTPLVWDALQQQLPQLVRNYSDRLSDETSHLYVRDAPKTLRGKNSAVARAAGDPNPLVAEIAASLLAQLSPNNTGL